MTSLEGADAKRATVAKSDDPLIGANAVVGSQADAGLSKEGIVCKRGSQSLTCTI